MCGISSQRIPGFLDQPHCYEYLEDSPLDSIAESISVSHVDLFIFYELQARETTAQMKMNIHIEQQTARYGGEGMGNLVCTRINVMGKEQT
jgi:hypothetical protein